MVRHIVVWKLQESADGHTKADNARRVKDRLMALPALIPQIHRFEVGINFNPTAAAWDVALYSEFHNRADLDTYAYHPEHVAVAKFIQSVRTDRAVVDYEM